jgi:predicted deacetylase
MPVHLSIHDVSPAWEREVELALEACDRVGAKPALLVVPNFHGVSPLLESPAFCARLRELQARGHEVYLHGFFHQSRPAPPAGANRVAWYFAQNVASGGEAEFADVTRDEARARLDDGEKVLRDAGLRVDGFIAPAWSMPAWLLPMLGERGIAFAEDHLHVYAPAAKKARPSVVLNWASRSPGRLFSTVAFSAFWRATMQARALFPARVAIHPADMRVLLLRREIDRTLDWARDDLVLRGTDLLQS